MLLYLHHSFPFDTNAYNCPLEMYYLEGLKYFEALFISTL